MKKSMLVAGLAALVFAACGSDSDQDKAAAALIRGAENDGIEVDEGCVKDVTGELSDEDAKALADLPDGADIDDATLSAEGDAIVLQLLDCADISSIIDQAIEDLRASGTEFDEQCVRDALTGVQPSELAGDVLPEEVTAGLIACVGG
ncbi:MAG: hypothetical protein ACR2O6_04165 [Ilumatobacteraceae bacterium]